MSKFLSKPVSGVHVWNSYSHTFLTDRRLHAEREREKKKISTQFLFPIQTSNTTSRLPHERNHSLEPNICVRLPRVVCPDWRQVRSWTRCICCRGRVVSSRLDDKQDLVRGRGGARPVCVLFAIAELSTVDIVADTCRREATDCSRCADLIYFSWQQREAITLTYCSFLSKLTSPVTVRK